ncbi:MAG: ATP-binding protein [Bacteroidota bacterium]
MRVGRVLLFFRSSVASSLLLAGLALAAVGATTCAAAQGLDVGPYRLDQFAVDQGLPGNQVYDIAQTNDGYLWVATNGGLARFDGHRFTVMTDSATGLRANRSATALHVGRGDTLFVGLEGGDVLAYAAHRFASYAHDTMASAPNSLAQDRAGRLWGSITDDLVYYENGRVYRAAEGLDLPPDRAVHLWGDFRLVRGEIGEVWALTADVEAYDEGQVTPFTDHCGANANAPTVMPRLSLARLVGDQIVYAGPSDHNFLTGFPSGGVPLRTRVDDGLVTLGTPDGVAHGRFRTPLDACPLLLDRDGRLWVRDGAMLAVYAPGSALPLARFALDMRLLAWFFASLVEDREGNLWIGTFNQGLFRIRRHPFEIVTTSDRVVDATVVSIEQGANGTVLLRDRGGFAYRVRNGAVSRVLDEVEVVEGFYEDDDGNLLYVTPPGRVMRSVGGEDTLLGTIYEFVGAEPRFIEDPIRPNVLWLDSSTELYRITDPFGPTPQLEVVLDDLGGQAGQTWNDVRDLAFARNGALWVGTMFGLFYIEPDQLAGPLPIAGARRFTTDDGLPDQRVRTLHQDAAGTLWIGTYGGGLARYKDGRFQTVREVDGLAENVVSALLEDEAGVLWMAGNRGIQRAHRGDLNALLDGEIDQLETVVRYGRESGIPNPESSGTTALQAEDGRFWFPTFEGAAVLDPALARRLDASPPRMQVEGVRVSGAAKPLQWTDGARSATQPAPAVELASSERRFTISYVGLSLRNPQDVRYRYILEGFDPDWLEAGTNRDATYTNVPHGTYTFRVQARSFGGIWSESDGVLHLAVAPYFYETRWFVLLSLLVVVGLGYAVYAVRMRTVKARERALSALVEARTQELAREKEVVALQAEDLRSLDQAKTRFFTNVSHEFRTPLTLILGPLEDLREGYHGPLPTPATRQVETAISNGRRLLRLVNQLLDVSRLESGKGLLQAVRVDMSAFVEQVTQSFVPMTERKQIAFRVESGTRAREAHTHAPQLYAYVDPEEFEKVLVNLLGNAFKFTPEGGTVVVKLDADDGALVLAVRDSGPGIAREHLPHLFERFYQADEMATRAEPGTGIGLALVRHLVELHGGTITAESDLGLGSTFTVRLPLGKAHLRDEDLVEGDTGIVEWVAEHARDTMLPHLDLADGAPQGPPDEAQAEDTEEDATTVLVVDDNPDIRAYVRLHLDAHYRVLEAGDGEDALALARTVVPDLIVSDVMMPGLDGYALCRALRADPDLDFVPVILLTAKASMGDKIEGLTDGADDYLTKPFDIRELEARIRTLIASRQRLRDRYASMALASAAAESEADEVSLSVEAQPSADEVFADQVRALFAARLHDDAFDLEEVAAAMGTSRSGFYRRVRDALGLTPKALVWEMRLERAATLLRQQQGTISEVAYATGFKSVAHFCRRFKTAYGVSPAAYAAERKPPEPSRSEA